DYIVYGNNNELDYQSLRAWVADAVTPEWILNLEGNRIFWLRAEGLKVGNWRKTESFYIAVRAIEHMYTGERLGTLFIGIPHHYFENVLSSVNYGEIELVNEQGERIFTYS